MILSRMSLQQTETQESYWNIPVVYLTLLEAFRQSSLKQFNMAINLTVCLYTQTGLGLGGLSVFVPAKDQRIPAGPITMS